MTKVPLLLVSSFFSACVIVCYKELMLSHYSPWVVLSARHLVMSVALLAFCWVKKMRSFSGGVSYWATLILISLFEIILWNLFVIWGLQYVSVSMCVVLLAFTPIFTLILSLLFLRGETLSWLTSVSLVLVFVALYILFDVGNQLTSFHSVMGALSILISSFLFSLSMLIIQKFSVEDNPIVMVRNINIIAVVVFFVVLLCQGKNHLSNILFNYSFIKYVALSGMCGVIGYVTYMLMIYNEGMVWTSMVYYVTPLCGVVLGVIIFKDRLPMSFLLSVVLITVSIVCASHAKQKARAVSD